MKYNKNAIKLKNNKNAEKYTLEYSMEKLTIILDYVEKNNVETLLQVKDHFKLPKNWLRYVQRKFKDNEDVFEMVEKIYTKLERNLYNKILSGEIETKMGIFFLKAYFKRVEARHTIKENTNTNYYKRNDHK